MGAIGGLLGLGGGSSGTGFAAPTGANILQPVTIPQLGQRENQLQGTFNQQQQLLNALQGVNGIQNQNNALTQMQGTANQYQNIANGTGPNPALAQLNQSTAQNVGQTGALMAGQRGASANVGQIARMAGRQGAETQQQAAGQAATLAAQQQLSGLQGLQQQQSNIANVAGSQVGNQVGQTNANAGAQQAQYGNLLNALGNYNNANVGMQSNINSTNAALAGNQQQGQQGLLGGIGNGIGSIFGLAQGGEIPRMASGGFAGQSEFGNFLSNVQAGAAPTVSSAPTIAPNRAASDLQQGVSNMVSGIFKPNPGTIGNVANSIGSSLGGGFAAPLPSPTGSAATGAGSILNNLQFSSGGKVPAKVSPGEKYLSPQAVEQVRRGADPMKVGETIPGKPQVAGAKDSYSNDTVDKSLQPGGIVIPRSKTQSDDPSQASMGFVLSLLAKRGKK